MSEVNYDPKNIKILVVDDHDLIRKSIMKVLRKKGFETFFECSNGQDALNVWNENSIDLIFCDLYMNRGNGFDVLNAVRSSATNDDVPFIIVTGEAGKDDIVKVVDLGADDYMLKPFQTEELERKTHKALVKYFNPSPLLFHIRKAERMCRSKEFEEALHCIEKALRIDERSARANHVRGVINIAKGNIAEGIDILERNIKDSPNFLKNYITLADTHLKLDDVNAAIQCMRGELSLNPKNVRRQIKVAQLLHRQGEFTDAIEHYRLALVENNKAKSALYGMGMSHAENDNLEKAFYYFKRARRIYPDYTKPLEAIVKYGLELDKAKAVEFVLRDEKKNFPKRIDTYIVLAKFLVAQERIDDAISTMNEAINVAGELPDLLQLKGSLQRRNLQLKEAITTFKKLVRVHNVPSSVFLLVDALTEAQDYTAAIKALQKVLRYKQTKPNVLSNLAVLFAKENDLTKSYFTYLAAKKTGLTTPKIAAATTKLQEIIKNRRIRKKQSQKADKAS